MKRYSIRDILNKLKWDPRYDFSKVVVVYIDRPKGFSEFYGYEVEEIGHKFVYLISGTAIPHHRIVEIRHGSEVIWKKS